MTTTPDQSSSYGPAFQAAGAHDFAADPPPLSPGGVPMVFMPGEDDSYGGSDAGADDALTDSGGDYPGAAKNDVLGTGPADLAGGLG